MVGVPEGRRRRRRGLEDLGLSRSKIRTIGALAEADLIVAGRADDEVRDRRLELPGIGRGRWTGSWPAASAARAFAAGDLGVRKAVAQWVAARPDLAGAARSRGMSEPFGHTTNLAVHTCSPPTLMPNRRRLIAPPSGGGG